jgi:hypothetical protein
LRRRSVSTITDAWPGVTPINAANCRVVRGAVRNHDSALS